MNATLEREATETPEHPHDRFARECEEAGFDVEPYDGRFYWKGPSVRCDDDSAAQQVIRATAVEIQRDNLGRGWVVYPKAYDYRPDESNWYYTHLKADQDDG